MRDGTLEEGAMRQSRCRSPRSRRSPAGQAGRSATRRSCSGRVLSTVSRRRRRWPGISRRTSLRVLAMSSATRTPGGGYNLAIGHGRSISGVRLGTPSLRELLIGHGRPWRRAALSRASRADTIATFPMGSRLKLTLVRRNRAGHVTLCNTALFGLIA